MSSNIRKRFEHTRYKPPPEYYSRAGIAINILIYVPVMVDDDGNIVQTLGPDDDTRSDGHNRLKEEKEEEEIYSAR